MSIFENFGHLWALVYIIPSWILYLLMLHIIFFSSVKQKFSPSLYSIFGFSAINNILNSVTYFIVYRVSKIPLLYSFLETWPTKNIFYPIIFTVMYYTVSAVPIYILILTINRLTIFSLKTNYNFFWKKYLKYFLAFCVLAPILFIWNLPFIEIENHPIPGNIVYIASTITTFAPWFNRTTNLLIESSILTIVSFALNLYIIFKIIQRRFFRKTNGGSSNNGAIKFLPQDVIIFAYNLVFFLGGIYSCFLQILLLINLEAYRAFVNDIQFVIPDLNLVVPVWFIAFTHVHFRKELIKLFIKPAENRIIHITG